MEYKWGNIAGEAYVGRFLWSEPSIWLHLCGHINMTSAESELTAVNTQRPQEGDGIWLFQHY